MENKGFSLLKVVAVIASVAIVLIMIPTLFANALSDALDEWFHGPNIETDQDFENWCNDPEELLKAIDMERFQPENFGYFYITEDDLKVILQAVVDYKKQQERTASFTYTYYRHYHTKKEKWEDKNKDNKKTEDEITYTYECAKNTIEKESGSATSMETDSEFTVYWQEIYALAAIAACDGNEDWLNNMVQYDSNGDGKQDSWRIEPVGRIDTDILQQVIESMCYQFDYYFDPSQFNGMEYLYESMENNAYFLIKEGTDAYPCNEVAELDYKEKKIPAVAPCTAYNKYKTVVWYYGADRKLQKRKIMIDPLEFERFAKSITNNHFKFDWYYYIISCLPGTNTPMNGGSISLIQQLDDMKLALNEERVIEKEETDIIGAGSLKLGDSVSVIDMSGFTGSILMPEDYNLDDESKRSLKISDNLTLEQIQMILDKLCSDKNKPFNQTAAGFYQFQQDYPNCSIIGILAIAAHEGGCGTSNLSINYWNFFGQTNDGSSPYVQIGGHKFCDYKSYPSVRLPADAAYKSCEYLYKHWIYRTVYHSNAPCDQDSYYAMQYAIPSHVYCPSEPGFPATGWLKGVTAWRSKLEVLVGKRASAGNSGGGNATIPPFTEDGGAIGNAVAAEALTYVGKLKYVWGGASLVNGADCSGFVMKLYEKHGISLPHSSRLMAHCGRGISLAEARPGDIVCYSGHVGIYIGKVAGVPTICHSSTWRHPVSTINANYRPIITIRRVA